MSDDFKEKLRSISFASVSGGARELHDRDRRWDKDMGAYSRLRKDGVQPNQIDGSADLETKATDDVEITYGLAKTKKGLKQAKGLVADLGA